MHLSQILIAIATFPIVFVGLAVALIFWPVRRPAGFGGAALADFRRFVARGDFAPPPPDCKVSLRQAIGLNSALTGTKGADLLLTIIRSWPPLAFFCHCPPTSGVLPTPGTGPLEKFTSPTIDL